MNSDINLASAKIKEAISLEPENFSIEIAATKMMIALNDCASGLARVEKYKEFYPYLEDLRLVASQALVCINKSQEALVLKNSFKNENPELIPFWTTLEVEAYLKLSQANRALELINAYYGIRDTSSFESQKANPEIVYWKWKAESELKIKSDRTASTYISQCKTLTKRQQRALISEPNLCRHMAEVENFIKKNNN